MPQNVFNLTAGEIALVALAGTLLAALMAGIFGVVIAKTNAYSALSMDVARAKRAYYERMFEPYFAQLDEEIVACASVVAFIESSDWTRQDSIDRDRFEEVFRPFRDRHSLDPTPTAIGAVAQRSAPVRQAYETLRQSRRHVTGAAHAVVYLVSTGDQVPWQTSKVEELRKSAAWFVETATQFRQGLEGIIFAGR